MSIDPLPVSPNQVDSDAMRTKINELISDNSSVTVGNTPPASPEEGYLWFDEDNAATYVYVGDPTNAWIQSNSDAGSSAPENIVQSNATTSADGLMSSEDKTKLDAIPLTSAVNMIIPTIYDGSYNGTTEKFRPGENATCQVIFVKQANWSYPKLYLRCTNHTRTELNLFTNEQQAIVEDYRIGTNGNT